MNWYCMGLVKDRAEQRVGDIGLVISNKLVIKGWYTTITWWNGVAVVNANELLLWGWYTTLRL